MLESLKSVASNSAQKAVFYLMANGVPEEKIFTAALAITNASMLYYYCPTPYVVMPIIMGTSSAVALTGLAVGKATKVAMKYFWAKLEEAGKTVDPETIKFSNEERKDLFTFLESLEITPQS